MNSAYRKIVNGLHNSKPLLHYREQLKIYNKNKYLLDDLKEKEKSFIKNHIYSKLKKLFINVSQKNLNNGNYFSVLIDLFEFVLTFKMKKTFSYIIKSLKI